ncbi:MAG: hypothetical protein DHS20C08_23800 [Rhodomicrobium sp.]|nr:MAG: hypothetical protein DHS20C08_23800 [Rhodomicrobium sp.]
MTTTAAAQDNWLLDVQQDYLRQHPEILLEGMIVTRSDLDRFQFTGPEDPGDNFTPFSSDDLDRKTVAGLRASVNGRLFDEDIQLSGFFILPMETELTKSGFAKTGAINGTNASYHANLNPAADISRGNSDSDDIFGMQVQHQTYLFGAEANWKSPLGIPGLLVGLRGLYFGERLASVTFDTAASFIYPPDPAEDDRDRTSIRTDNYMTGVQIGLDQMFEISDGISIGGAVKAGVFHNHIERHRTFNRDFRDTAANTMGDELKDDKISYAIEINPRLNINLAPGVSLTAGGWFLWADNVAEALPHFSSAADRDDRDLRADGDVYFWGGSIGLTFELDQLMQMANAPSSDLPSLTPPPLATPEELDERIALLEETTARRGNSKVSLEVFGQLNQMLMAWDDGDLRDAYVVDNINSPTRFGLKGEARISVGMTAGYLIEIQNDFARSVNVSQEDDEAPGGSLEIRNSYMWLRHNQLGKITLGYTSPATDNIIHNDFGGVHVAASSDTRLIGGGLLVRHTDEIEQGNDALIGRTPLIDFLPGLDTSRGNFIRYDTPRWKGLTFSAAWGEDDFWDASLKYRLNWNDWKYVMEVGYLQDLDEPTSSDLDPRDRREWKGSASIFHQPSGLFLTGAFTHREYHGERSSDQTRAIVTPPGTNRPDFDYRYLSSGIRKKWTSLGDTSLYVEWARGEDGITGRREAGNSGEVTDSEIVMFGTGLVQRIDEASMELFLGVRHFEFQIEGYDSQGRFDAEDLEDINIFYTGAKIKF